MTQTEFEMWSAKLHDLARDAQDAGINVMLHMSHYGFRKEGGHSTSYWHYEIMINKVQLELETYDHIVMDGIRDLSVEWSNQSHESKLEWKDS